MLLCRSTYVCLLSVNLQSDFSNYEFQKYRLQQIEFLNYTNPVVTSCVVSKVTLSSLSLAKTASHFCTTYVRKLQLYLCSGCIDKILKCIFY